LGFVVFLEVGFAHYPQVSIKKYHKTQAQRPTPSFFLKNFKKKYPIGQILQNPKNPPNPNSSQK
jgi:hypothetical protein